LCLERSSKIDQEGSVICHLGSHRWLHPTLYWAGVAANTQGQKCQQQVGDKGLGLSDIHSLSKKLCKKGQSEHKKEVQSGKQVFNLAKTGILALASRKEFLWGV